MIKGQHHSLEARKRISQTLKSNIPLMEERRAICKQGLHKGHKSTQEQSDEMSKQRRGRIASTESKIKASITMKNRFHGHPEKHPHWKGGTSFSPYCHKFTKEFKERVRAYYGYVCVECGTPQKGEKLHIHHVTFNKNSCCDNTPPLFVALCHSCHAKTSFKREYWENHFTYLINQYHGGKCYLSIEEYNQLTGV